MRRPGSWLRRRTAPKSDGAGTAPLPQRPIGRYILALVLIGMLATLSTFVTHRALSTKARDATVLEYGLRQGYLAARGSELSYLAVDGLSQPLGRELVESIDEISRVHGAFVSGDTELDLPAMSNTDTEAFLFGADSSLEDFSGAASRIQYAVGVGGRPLLAAADAVAEASVEYGLAMQRVVASYLRTSGEQVVALEQTEYFLLVATLALLVLEGLFLFRPAVRNLQRSWKESSEAHRSERELDQQRLNYLARYDSLTGMTI